MKKERSKHADIFVDFDRNLQDLPEFNFAEFLLNLDQHFSGFSEGVATFTELSRSFPGAFRDMGTHDVSIFQGTLIFRYFK